MKTRFQRLSFALGLSIIIGAAAGKVKERESCYSYYNEKEEISCKQFYEKDKDHIKETHYNSSIAIATSFAVFGLCLMINAFVKEDSNKAE
mgnify:CR=1 FL=1